MFALTAESNYRLRHVCRSAWKNSDLTGQIFIAFGTRVFLENPSRKFKFH